MGAVVLFATVVNGVLVVAVTELLSAIHRLNLAWVSVSWAVVTLGQGVLWVRFVRRAPLVASQVSPWGAAERGMTGAVALVLVCTGLTALISAPNNWDSMTYHMSRVAHWAQNQSVDFYPTWIERQLFLPPFAEYVILHLQILSQGDRFANLVQWLSLLGCTLGCPLIARELGANPRGQVIAAVFCATLPMAVLQASSTQNDLVVSMWMVFTVYFAIRLVTGRTVLFTVTAMGTSLGLALLTKPSAYFFAAPFVGLAVLAGFRTQRWKIFPGMAGVLALALALNLSHYARTVQAYGHPFGPDYHRTAHLNEVFGAKPALSNVVRNLSLHGGLPPARLHVARHLQEGVEWMHRVIGLDVNHRRITFAGKTFQIPGGSATSFHEDFSGNPLHLLIAIVSIAAVLVARTEPHHAWLRKGYVLALVGAFLLLSVGLRWTPWSSRLQLPLFVLAAPLVGAGLGRARFDRLAPGVAFLLLILSLLPIAFNVRRPLLGARSILSTPRSWQYFGERKPELRNSFLEGARFLHGRRDREIGLVLGADSYEYPLWRLVPGPAERDVRLCHVGVDNPSRQFRAAEPCSPSAVVSDRLEGDRIEVDGRGYRMAWALGELKVYIADGSRPK